jgi:hypothetical protein
MNPLNDGETSSGKILAKSLSYIPTIAYCNMFSIFYLEIISLTKLVAGKIKSDSAMGMKVNAVISIFYVLLFSMVMVMQAIASEVNQNSHIAIEVYFIKNWYQMQVPYHPKNSLPRTRFTIFDLNMLIISCVLFIHCLMNLFIAKESALIHADEVYNKSMSQLLDMKRQGGDGTNFNRSEASRGGDPTAESGQEPLMFNGVQSQLYRFTYQKMDPNQSNKVENIVYLSVVLLALLNT